MPLTTFISPGAVDLKLEQATFSRQNRPLFSHLDWHLRPNEQWAVYGPVGAGKTTFLQAILGHFLLLSGKFKVKLWDKKEDAFRIIDRTTWLGQTALVSFQQQNDFFNYGRAFYQQRYQSLTSELVVPTVQEILQQVATDSKEEMLRVASLLQLTDLLPVEVIKLSNGQTRKLQIARALLQRPKLLLLDNPFTGLDTASRAHLKEITDSLMDHGTQVLLATNQPELPEKITHVLWLENFKIKNVYSRPDFLVALTKATNQAKVSENIPGLQKLTKSKPNYEVAVRMEAVNVRYSGKKILQDIDWTVNRGEKWALIGPNGSGKSTLLSLIYADNPQAFANKITLFDRRKGSGESIWDIKKRIGFVSPELHLYFRQPLTSAEVAATGFTDTLTRPKLLNEFQQKLIEQHFAFFNRLDLVTQAFRQLSAGEQRLVLLIRSLVKNPDLIIWDEPFQGLSADYITLATALLEQYCVEDSTLILVSHYQYEIPAFVQNSLYIAAGLVQRVTGR